MGGGSEGERVSLVMAAVSDAAAANADAELVSA